MGSTIDYAFEPLNHAARSGDYEVVNLLFKYCDPKKYHKMSSAGYSIEDPHTGCRPGQYQINKAFYTACEVGAAAIAKIIHGHIEEDKRDAAFYIPSCVNLSQPLTLVCEYNYTDLALWMLDTVADPVNLIRQNMGGSGIYWIMQNANRTLAKKVVAILHANGMTLHDIYNLPSRLREKLTTACLTGDYEFCDIIFDRKVTPHKTEEDIRFVAKKVVQAGKPAMLEWLQKSYNFVVAFDDNIDTFFSCYDLEMTQYLFQQYGPVKQQEILLHDQYRYFKECCYFNKIAHVKWLWHEIYTPEQKEAIKISAGKAILINCLSPYGSLDNFMIVKAIYKDFVSTLSFEERRNNFLDLFKCGYAADDDVRIEWLWSQFAVIEQKLILGNHYSKLVEYAAQLRFPALIKWIFSRLTLSQRNSVIVMAFEKALAPNDCRTTSEVLRCIYLMADSTAQGKLMQLTSELDQLVGKVDKFNCWQKLHAGIILYRHHLFHDDQAIQDAPCLTSFLSFSSIV